MKLLILVFAMFLLFMGHVMKVRRWTQFIEIYERPPRRRLYCSLGLGYFVNFLIPFHLGDIVRAFHTGRKLKNSYGFSFATVIVDRYLDFLIVGLLFLFFFFTGYSNDSIRETTQFYIFIGLILVILSITAIVHGVFWKKAIKSLCSLFNSRIESKLLFFWWSVISTFQDIIKIDKIKLFFNTFFMWGFYLCSYYVFTRFWMLEFNENLLLIDVFNQLFSVKNIDLSTVNNIFHFDNLYHSELVIRIVYFLLPILGLFLFAAVPYGFSKLFLKNDMVRDRSYLKLLPFENEIDKMTFLETFFSSTNKDFVEKFIEINRDISILKDYSGGSKATTLLCMDDDKTFFRKFVIGEDAGKLQNQVEWIKNNTGKIPLPELLDNMFVEKLCSYDMAYRNSIVGFFDYIHTNPLDKSWGLLSDLLRNLHEKLYVNIVSADENKIMKYIQIKVIRNLKIIQNDPLLKPLLEYDSLIINGKSVKNISLLEKYLTFDFLKPIFISDLCTEIHGDLTVENIICDNDDTVQNEYYLIDPNNGNIHNSYYLDYGKLFQSLHGGYEFLSLTDKVSVRNNKIDFLFTKSQTYNELFQRLYIYLEKQYGVCALKSVFFHEIVHWLRLMPYKLAKSGEKAVIFYSGLLLIMNDIIDRYTVSEIKNKVSEF